MAEYCTYPCVITGKVKLDSILYDFELNEGGFAVLKNKGKSDTLAMRHYMENADSKGLVVKGGEIKSE